MKLYKLVQNMLEEYPETRSDDRSLFWHMHMELHAFARNTMSYQEFLEMPPYSSVVRARRMVQANDRKRAEKFGVKPRWQPNPVIKMLRKKRQNEKGTHVYRENV